MNSASVVGVDRTRLSGKAEAHFETLAFIHEHPEYLVCRQNSAAFTTEFKKRLEQDANWRPTLERMEEVYFKLQKQGKLLTREKASEILAVGNSADVEKLVQSEGVPRYDDFGRLIGYDWPESFREKQTLDLARENRAGRATGGYLRKLASENAATDKNYKPSKREWHSWGPDRQREWLEESGHWGGDLPDYLR